MAPATAEVAEAMGINAEWPRSTRSTSSMPRGDDSRMVERAAIAANLGIKGNAHMLRHVCGYKLVNGGHDAAHVPFLPPSWGTLYELTKLDDDTFEARVADGTINRGMEPGGISQIVKAHAAPTANVS